MKNNKILQLFFAFLKIGAFTFGGGYAMIPLIQKEVVANKKWITDEDIADVIAIAETTPGPIAVNAATFVGYKVAGIGGALASTVGVVLPSFVTIIIIVMVLAKYMENEIVKNAFWGIRIAVIALMIKAFITMFKQCPKNAVSYSIAGITLILVGIFDLNVLIIIIASAFIGIVYQAVKAGIKR